jgi:hypothetical protein
MKKAPLTPREKLQALTIQEKIALMKGIQANDERTLQYYYRNFVDKSALRKGQSMDQLHYMIARKECEEVDGMGGNSDFDKYIFNKSYDGAMLA